MFFTKKKAIILIIICSIFFILTYKDVRSEEIKEICGNAKIIDGDTIKIIQKKYDCTELMHLNLSKCVKNHI